MHSPMPTPRLRSLFTLAVLSIVAACGGSSTTPRVDNQPVNPRDPNDPRNAGHLDSTRRNSVIENNRPDVSARAGLLVVANQEANTATVLNTATMSAIATVPVGAGPHEVAMSPDGR